MTDDSSPRKVRRPVLAPDRLVVHLEYDHDIPESIVGGMTYAGVDHLHDLLHESGDVAHVHE